MAIIPNATSKIAEIATPEQKKQKKMLIIFGAVVLIAAAVLYFNFSSPSSPGAGAPVVVSSQSNVGVSEQPLGSAVGLSRAELAVPSLEKVDLDFNVFNSQRFESLRDFSAEGLDISSIEKGRNNPFKPY